VFLPDLEKRMQSNIAEKKRVEEEMAKFHNQVAKDKKGPELDKLYPNVANPNAGIYLNNSDKINNFFLRISIFVSKESSNQE